MADSSNKQDGVGFVGLLTIVFITLKLLGKITWSWWWILSPVWITALILLVTIAIVGIAIVGVVLCLKK